MGVFTRDTDDAKSTLKPAPYAAHRSLTASAIRVNVRDKSQVDQMKQRRAIGTWQEDAWEYYDLIGEVKYAFRLFANVLSRIRLVGAMIDDEDSPPIPIRNMPDLDEVTKRAVNRAMRRAFGATDQSEILRKAAINLLVVGEFYLVQLPPRIGVREEEQWKVLSINELITKDDKYYYKTHRNQKPVDWEELPATTFMGRIWSAHARYADEADSSMHALVGDCDDLFLYSRATRASARSRLNAGAFFVPEGMSVSAEAPTDFPDDIPLDPEIFADFEDPQEDLFEQEMIDHMTAPIADESAASAVVPLIIRGTREDGAALRHIKFDRPFDQELSKRLERSLERILQGIDLPKDIVTGLANIKYSNAVQIEESLYTAHIEPVVLLLCDAFRAVYLVPALRSEGVPDDVIRDIVIWYDPSAIMTAPDKSSAASLGHDNFALSDEAWRRANGFAESDKPDGDELARRLALTRGALNDSTTEAVLRTFMADILDAARNQALANSPTGPLSPAVQDALGGPTPPPEPGGAPGAPSAGPIPPAGGPPPIVDGPSSGPTPPPAVPGN